MIGSILLSVAYGIVAADAVGIEVQVERNVAVKMRDGVVLRADVHRPDRGGPYPVLVRRSPYGKGGSFDRYVKAGYIVVSQDARGRYESEGKWESFVRFETHDAVDGYDTRAFKVFQVLLFNGIGFSLPHGCGFYCKEAM